MSTLYHRTPSHLKWNQKLDIFCDANMYVQKDAKRNG